MAAALEPFSAPIEATAAIELDGDRVAKISARTSGRLVKIAASQGDAVKTGQALAWFDSPELGQALAEYAKAKGRADLARKNLEREETLFSKKISPEKDVIRARQELAEAEADLTFANEKFHLLGIDVEQFGNKQGGNQHPLIAVTSPISGSVIERAATQGEVVGPEKPLFTVADLSKLWVIIDIYEKDLGRIKSGTAVKVSTTAYAEKSFRGFISYLGEVMDEKTQNGEGPRRGREREPFTETGHVCHRDHRCKGRADGESDHATRGSGLSRRFQKLCLHSNRSGEVRNA